MGVFLIEVVLEEEVFGTGVKGANVLALGKACSGVSFTSLALRLTSTTYDLRPRYENRTSSDESHINESRLEIGKGDTRARSCN